MPGTVLLLAASPVGKSCLVDAASVLPVLAAVPPAVLSGTETANVVELADPLEPQAVLTRLRAVAATPGPLTVFVAGQLALDRRQHLPHLALARTTPATVRYTALPWQWIREEFRLRTPGSTTLFLDLHADAGTWGWLRTHALDSGRNNAVYGRIAPPPSRRKVAVPAYMKTIATILRSGHRPAEPDLHQQAFGRLGSEAYGDIVLTVPSVPAAAPGRVPSGWGVRAGWSGQGRSSAQGAVSVQPVVSAWGVVSVQGGASVQQGSSVQVVDPARGVVTAQRMASAQGVAPGQGVASAQELVPVEEVAPAQQGTPAQGVVSAQELPRTRELPQAKGSSRTQDVPPAPPSTPDPARSPAAQPLDAHAYIAAAVQSGRHQDAEVVAAAHGEAAARDHGAASEQALHWAEVRADLAMFAGDPVRSCRIWLTVAEARLGAGQAVDAGPVETAVDRAHHQWAQVRDGEQVRQLGIVLAGLRMRVPGRRQGALENVQTQLRKLQTQG
ncbi:hypothetical protein [Streptomyces griseorubiginosus]|uniref:Uncharacterized protein n=1 Tax=Streptomyces griseorubiginosus TaxID=67304 RepID=A0AAI8KZ82_9ACTN|nr:hypothetical protein [Streptomyces griseorubiginosus]AYC39909.1 hypothetical protein DWG14_04152 [Streptomyces griseorubiginosus]